MFKQPEKEPDQKRLQRLIDADADEFEEDDSLNSTAKAELLLQLEDERLHASEVIMQVKDEREKTMLGLMRELEQDYDAPQSIWGTIGEGDDRAVICTVPYTGRLRNVVQYVVLTRADYYIVGYKGTALGDVKYLRRVAPKELDREPVIGTYYGGLYYGYRALHKHFKSKRQKDGTIQDVSSALVETDSGIELRLVFQHSDQKVNRNSNFGATIYPISHKQAIAKLSRIYAVVDKQYLAEIRAEHKRMPTQPQTAVESLKRKDVTYDLPDYKGISPWQRGAVFIGDHVTSLPKRALAFGINATTALTGVTAAFERKVLLDQGDLLPHVAWRLRIRRDRG